MQNASTSGSGTISALLQEDRRFPPSKEFAARANAKQELYDRAKADPEAFLAEMAGELEWAKPWQKVLEWDVPWAKWFVGGQLNASVNCVDRHLRDGRKNKTALI